jgi:hypothetical protein
MDSDSLRKNERRLLLMLEHIEHSMCALEEHYEETMRELGEAQHARLNYLRNASRAPTDA